MHTHPDGHANVYAGEKRRIPLTPDQKVVFARQEETRRAVQNVKILADREQAKAPNIGEHVVTAADKAIHDRIVQAEIEAATARAEKLQQEFNARQAVDQAIEHPQPAQTEAPVQAVNVPNNVIDATERFKQRSAGQLTPGEIQRLAETQVARDAVSAAFYGVADKRAA